MGRNELAITNKIVIRHYSDFELLVTNVKQVPLFDQMDGRMLDAIRERLKPCLCTPSTFLVREGDPVNEMLSLYKAT